MPLRFFGRWGRCWHEELILGTKKGLRILAVPTKQTQATWRSHAARKGVYHDGMGRACRRQDVLRQAASHVFQADSRRVGCQGISFPLGPQSSLFEDGGWLCPGASPSCLPLHPSCNEGGPHERRAMSRSRTGSAEYAENHVPGMFTVLSPVVQWPLLTGFRFCAVFAPQAGRAECLLEGTDVTS